MWAKNGQNDSDTSAFQDRRTLIIERNRIKDGWWDGDNRRVVSNDGEGRLPIGEAWDEAVEIDGKGDGYIQSIDRDQAVDEEGNANYANGYRILMDDDDHYCDYTAQEMEDFAQTW